MQTNDSDTKRKKMPDDLRAIIENMAPMRKMYCEYRAKGLNRPDAAAKAGSKAKDRMAMSRIGYSWEQDPDIKRYINWLEEARAMAAVVDELEIVNDLRDIIFECKKQDKFNEATKAIELLGKMIGAFNADKKGVKRDEVDTKGVMVEGISKRNNTDAFLSDDPEAPKADRINKLRSVLQSTSKRKP